MPRLSSIARGLERGLASYLTQEQRERERERREAEDRRRQERHETRQSEAERRRTLQEAEAAERGIELPGVKTVREAGLRPMVGDRELSLEAGAGPGLEPRPTSEAPLLEGERGFFDRPPQGGAGRQGGMDPRIMEEELSSQAQAEPGAEPDVEPGALDPQTGQFVTEPVFRARPGAAQGQGPSIGQFLEEGRVERQGPEFRLSSGQRFEPGAREEQILQEELNRVMRARPELSREEARLLLEGREDILTYGRQPEDELDRTFNVAGREVRTVEEARRLREELGIGGGGRGRGGESLTQTEQQARDMGFDNVANFRRFQDRMADLEEVYGNTQGDPLFQRALEARARGHSESEVMQNVVQDARQAGWEDDEIQQLRQDLRRFFGQRNRRQIGAMQSGNIGDLPDYGSGFDLEFETSAPADTAGGRRPGGVGAVRNR